MYDIVQNSPQYVILVLYGAHVLQTYLFYFIHIHTHTFKKLKENIVTQEISLKYEYTYNKIKRWMATYECKKLISRTPIETRDFIAFPRAQRRLIIRRTFVSTLQRIQRIQRMKYIRLKRGG